MKRNLGACLVLAMALCLFGALAYAETHPGMAGHAAAAAVVSKTVTGSLPIGP